MSARTTWLVLALVLALGGLAWWQLDREGRRAAFDRPLFRDVDPSRVTRVRVEHLERDVQLSLAREPDGTWSLVDPIEYPAEPGLVQRLFEIVQQNRAVPVPEADAAKLSLDPPRAVLEVFEQGPAGPRVQRVEVGTPDLDGRSVFVRLGQDGRREPGVFRTLQNLDTTLERDLDDWRRQEILALAPRSVLSIRRDGAPPLEDGAAPSPVPLTAGIDPQTREWRASRPFAARLDPVRTSFVVARAASLRAEAFELDLPEGLAGYGLLEPHPPSLTFELETVRGERLRLLFGRSPDGRNWYCTLAGGDHVWRVDEASLILLAAPAETLLEHRVLRARRDEVSGVRLTGDGVELRLRRRGRLWEVAPVAGGAPGEWRVADPAAVEDLLGAVEAHELEAWAPEVEPFADTGDSLFVELGGGDGEAPRLEGGWLAPAPRRAGLEGIHFRRPGDDVVFFTGVELLDLARTPLERWWTLQVVRLPEVEQVRIELREGASAEPAAADLAFVRSPEGLWMPEGVEREDRDFARLVDALLSLRAGAYLDPDDPGGSGPLRDAVRVDVLDRLGETTTYVLGRSDELESPAVVWSGRGARARLESPLLDGLRALFERGGE